LSPPQRCVVQSGQRTIRPSYTRFHSSSEFFPVARPFIASYQTWKESCLKILFALVLCLGVLGNANAQATLQIRLAEEQPATGLKEATVAHSDKKLYLHESAVITNADVSAARVVPASATTFEVLISLTPEGSKKMMSATQAHIGKPLAILLDGIVVAAPTVRSTIQREAVISGDWSRQEADDIAAEFTRK
jgi:hypothetical protein